MPDETNGDFVRITNREIWVTLNDLKDRVSALGRNIDESVGERIETHKRLRALELRFYGILAGLVGALTMFGAILLKRT